MNRLVLAGGVVGLMLVPLAAAREAGFPGKAGKLVFQSNRGGNYELYVANANGSGVRKLLSRPETDEFNANWSPSGAWIVFQSGPPDRSTYDIWLVKADGRRAKPLVGGVTNDRAPQFCDEKTVVFTRAVSETNSEVFAIGTNGKGLRKLTDHPASDSFPTCNPKGTRIAFISSRDGPPRIYEMTRTGGGLRPLTDPGALDPDYSSDGKAIAYVALDADPNLEVFTKNLATGKVVQRTNVRPPFEYRLPKFVPEAAGRSASGRGDEADGVIATYRNTQASEEAVHRVQAGTVPQPVAEPGSAASAQPLGPCLCYEAFARVVDATRKIGVRNGKAAAVVRVTVRWTLDCYPGVGGCKAELAAESRPSLTFDKGRETIECRGPCDRFTMDVDRVVGAGDPNGLAFGFTLSSRGCVSRPQDFTLVFTRSGKELDRRRSDLNGNGKADGQEKNTTK